MDGNQDTPEARNRDKLWKAGVRMVALDRRRVRRLAPQCYEQAPDLVFSSLAAAESNYRQQLESGAVDPYWPGGRGGALRAGFTLIRMDEPGRRIRAHTPGRDWHVHSRYPDLQALLDAWETLIKNPMILEG